MAWIAVSEIATAHGKQQSITRITRSLAVVSVMASGATIAAPPVANQLPTGGQVSAGSAAIATSGNSMTVTQSSNRAAINWNTFDIGSAASVNFVQPSSQAIALNRVISSNPSQIYGQLSSNGQVYLINPSGVFFAPGSQVNVGGIVATTHQMSDAAFMAGSTTFERNGSIGKVINEGTIQTSLNGYIAMLAPEVRNSGLLLAQSGTVALAAAEKITLNFGPTSKLDSITVTAATLDTLVENRQAVRAPNGLIILSARSATQLAASVVNSGTLEAKGISQQGGRILLEGSTVNNTGTLDVSSDTAQAGTIQINGKNVSLSGNVIATSPVQGGALKVQASEVLNVNANINLVSAQRGGQVEFMARQVSIADTVINVDGDVQGGNVQVQATNVQNTNPFEDPFNPPSIPLTVALTGLTTVNSRSRNGQGGNATILGDYISLDGNTTINVSGALGGGNVLVGGDWQGSNGTYQATTVYMAQNVTIDASATDNGNGGKVVLWSDTHNANSSTIISGVILAKGGANGGNGGKVETSGYTLNTDSAVVDAGSLKGSGGLWLLDPYDYVITNAGAINSALSSGTNVTIDTLSPSSVNGSYSGSWGSGNITISDNISKYGGGAATLTLNAANWIAGSGGITSTSNLLNVVFQTGGGFGIYTGYISGNVSLTKSGTGMVLLSNPNSNFSGGVTINAGTLGVYTNNSMGTGTVTVAGDSELLLGRGVTSVANNFSLSANLSVRFDRYVDYLLVAGGGSGGDGRGGGGGAGGVIVGNTDLTAGNYSIAVGAGGASVTNDRQGNNGENTTAFGLSAIGGGGGGGWAPGVGAGLNGGSGGGSTAAPFTGGSGTAGQGNAGLGRNTYLAEGGGGGGAGGAATNQNGGIGIETFITGSSLWVGGGGGAGALVGSNLQGTGGLGGGGAGSSVGDGRATNGTANTGGGGGGSEGFYGTSGAGGSGVVYVRYLGSAAGTGGNVSSGTGSATGFTLHSFTSTETTTLSMNPLKTTFSGNIGGTGGFIFNPGSDGTIVFTGSNNTYSGKTAVQSGYFEVRSSGGFSSASAVNISSGSYYYAFASGTVGSLTGSGNVYIDNGYTLTSGGDNSSIAFSGCISGSGNFGKTGSGRQTLSSANTYTGTTTVSAGTLAISNTAGLGTTAAGTTVASGATLDLQNVTVGAEAITLNGGTLLTSTGTSSLSGAVAMGANSSVNVSGAQLTLSGVVSGAYSLTKAGSGSVVLSNASTYSGSTNITAGTLNVTGTLADTTVVNVSSGANYTVSNTDTISSFVGTGNISLVTGFTLTAFGDNSSATFGGAIAGAGHLHKRGNGTLTLTGAATYTGNTTLSGGGITFTNTNAPSTSRFNGAGTVLIQPSGSSFGADQTISYNVANTISSFTVGSSTNAANLTISGASNINVSGPIGLYGGNILINANLTTTSAGTGHITIGASGYIATQTPNLSISTNNGNILFAANTDNSGGGSIALDRATISSNGGNITLGGGNLEGSSYAEGVNTLVLPNISGSGQRGIFLYSSTLTAGGGNITLRGKGLQGSGNTGNYDIGIDIASYNWAPGPGNLIETTGTGSIILNGVGGNNSDASSHKAGINFYNDLVGVVNTISTVNGSITMTGTTGTGVAAIYAGINLDGGIADIVSTRGDISLVGIGGGSVNGTTVYGIRSNNGQFNLGGNNVTLSADQIGDYSVFNISNTGNLIVQSYNASFASPFLWDSRFSLDGAQTGLRIGRASNTQDVTVSNSIGIEGSISIYGGNVTVDSLISSNATAESLIYATAGDLLLNAGFNQTNGSGSTLTLKATGNVTQASTADIVGSGSATLGVVAWANSNNVTGQANATVSLGNITTNNGSVWAGGALVPGNGTILWRDMSVGQSGALISLNGNIAVGTGSVLLYEKTGNALTMGAPNLHISTAAGGYIILVSDSFASNALTLNSDGYLYFLSNSNGADYSSTNGFIFNGTLSGNVFTGSDSLTNIKIGHWSNSLTATPPGDLIGISIGVDGGSATPYYLDNAAGNVTVNADMLMPGFVQIHGYDVTVNANVGAGSAVYGTHISAYGNVTQGVNSKFYNFITFDGGTSGNVAVTNVDNQITKLYARNLVDLSVVNNYTSAAMDIARIFGLAGQIDIRNAGDININGTIDTSSVANSTSSPALLIAAGYNQSVGTTNNNVTITGTQIVSTGSGGLGLIYTGSATNSGLTSLLGSGSGRYRYSTNLTSAGYNTTAAPLSSGINALYRETPTLTLSTANASIVYGNSSSTAITTTAVNGDTLADIFGAANVPTSTVSGNTSTAGFYAAGNHTINISGPTTNLLGYATPTYSNGTMTIAKADLTVAAGSTVVANKAYDGSTNATFTSNGTLMGVMSNGSVSDQVTLTTNGSFSSMNVGNNITITMADTISSVDADNYQLTAQPTVTANITPVNITVTANNLSRTYGASNPTSGNVTLTSGSLYNGDTLSTADLTSNATTASNIGNYSLTASNLTMSSGLVGNYNISYANGTLTITQANITVTANDLSRTYGAANPTSGAVTLTSGSLYNGDTLSTATISSNAMANSSVGNYGLAASNLTMSSGLVGNYNVSYANGTLTLTKAPLGIIANGTYSGSTTVLPGSFVITGLQNGETITGISSLIVNNANVAATTNGTQYITGIGASTGTADLNNYQLNASRNATLGGNTTNVFTMARANLTVTPDNGAIFIGEALPSGASYAVSYTGLVGGQTADSLILAGTLTPGNVTNSAGAAGNTSVPAGTYNLSAGDWSADNYAIQYTNGTFTVSPADALLIQVGARSMTYGTNLTSNSSLYGTPTVRYMANGSPAVMLTLNASQSSGNHYVYDDGMTGSVTFNLTVANGSYSGSNNLIAGSGYQLSGANVTPAGPNLILTNGTTTTGALAVNALGVTASASNVSKVYDGTTSVNGLVINLSPSVIGGDSVTAGGSGAFGSANAGSNISYSVTGLALTGADASNYVLSGGTSFSGSNGVITPRTVTLSANQVYSGSTVLTNVTIGNLVGSETLTYTGNASSKNVQDNGTNYIDNLLLGNGANGGLSGNYQLPTLNVSNAPVTITRLNSVTWTGGSTGNWFDPANWAGGAVPDLNNVANVILPAGVTVSFNNTVVSPAQLGAVSIDSLTGGSANLSQTAGTLNVGLGGITLYSIDLANGTLTSLGPINLTSYIQSGGNLTASGNLTTQAYNQSGGLAMILGMLTTTNYTQSNGTTNVTGNLTATNYTQSNGTTNVQGNLLLTNFTQTGGLTTTSSNLTVNGSYAQTGGQVNVTGNANITTTSAMTLGNLTVGGTLNANSTSGNINQSAGSQMSVTGLASFLAPLGLITLNPGNNFAGGNSIIDRNGDRNKPSTADQWMYQYIMSQGGTTLYAPMPKTQTKSSAGTYKALAYNDQIILLDSQEQQSEVSEAASQTNQSSLNKSNDVEPIALNKFPEVSSKKAVEQNGKVFLVNTDLKPKSGENYTDFALTNPNKLVD